jgi:chloride channel 3/4/5
MFNGGAGQNGRRRNNNKTFHNLRRSSMAIRDKLLSRRRSTVYDDVKEALVKENNGIRVWYHNYTTIGMG